MGTVVNPLPRGATGRSPLLHPGDNEILLALLPLHRRRLPLGREVLDGMGLGEALCKLFPQRRHREGSARRGGTG